MSTFNGQVSQSSDDAREAANGSVSITGTTAAGAAGVYWGFRFQNVTIPQGATISAATINVWNTSGSSINTFIYCEAVDNSTTFAATSTNISSRTPTTHSETWNASGLAAGGFITSVDISASINDVISRSGWASGNALNVIFEHNATAFTIEMYDGSPTEAAELSITYTSSSPPGSPSSIKATYNSTTSLNLTWSQGSGTVTDNKVQYSTDDATWTTVDIGSAVTSYTLTGLTANTLYYIQVAAANTGGTSSYSPACVGFTGPGTGSVTVSLISPDVATTGWSLVGAFSTYWQTLGSTNDANYASAANVVADVLKLTLQTAPEGALVWVTSVTLNARMKTISGLDTNLPGFAVVLGNSGGTMNAFLSGNLTTSFANYSGTEINLDNPNRYSPILTQKLANWTGAQIWVTPPDTAGDVQISELSLTIDFWVYSDSDDSGTFGDQMGMMASSAAFIVNDQQQTSFVAYAVRIGERIRRAIESVIRDIKCRFRSLSNC